MIPSGLDRFSAKGVDGQLAYAIGDVHGCYGLLTQLLAEIATDAGARAKGRRPILIFCGDYIDRGPQSAKVLEALIWLQRADRFELHLLKGNHEQALLDFVADPENSAPWLGFGGAETLASYGVGLPDTKTADDLIRARDDLLDVMPASHLHLLQTQELIVGLGDFAFVHAGVRPGIPLSEQTEPDLLWIRGDFLDLTEPLEKVIVHGHTWIDEHPQIRDYRIGLDSGAYHTGVLTGLRIEDGQLDILQARAIPERLN